MRGFAFYFKLKKKIDLQRGPIQFYHSSTVGLRVRNLET